MTVEINSPNLQPHIISNTIPHLDGKATRRLLSPSGPAFAFVVPWIIVLLLHPIAPCQYISPGFSRFTALIMANIISALVIALTVNSYRPQRETSTRMPAISRKEKQCIAILTATYVICQIAQIIHFKGFPLMWLFTGDKRTYFDFGIKSVNGLLNAMYLLAVTGHVMAYMANRNKTRALTIGLLLLFPVFVLSRQLLISAFLQGTCAILLFRPRLLRRAMYVLVILFTVFIIMGNFRTGLGQLIKLSQPKEWVPERAYPLIWIYNYVVAPYNNVHKTIGDTEPLYYPYHEIQGLIPTAFRAGWQEEHSNMGALYQIAHPEVSTVNTFYWDLLNDFGVLYAFLFTATLQLAATIAYRSVRRAPSLTHTATYSVLYSILALSIFSNHLLYLPVSFQLAMIGLTSAYKMLRFSSPSYTQCVQT